MIQKLLDAYGKALGLIKPVECTAQQLAPGMHKFADAKACRECEAAGRKTCAHEDEHVVLKLQANHVISVVEIEKELEKFNGKKCELKGGRCDYAFFDNSNILLAELTCSLSKYIDREDGKPSKRTKARSQLANVISLLAAVEENAAFFASLSSRTALFASRIKDEIPDNISDEQNVALRGMMDFQQPAPQRDKDKWQNLGHGFRFVEVEYPDPFMFP